MIFIKNWKRGRKKRTTLLTGMTIGHQFSFVSLIYHLAAGQFLTQLRHCHKKCNNLHQALRNCESCSLFRCSILKFIKPSSNSFFNCQNIILIKYVTRLRLGQSHLWEHKLKYSSQDILNRPCNCDMDIESSTPFLLQCPFFI